MKSRDGKSQRREKKRREAFIGEHHFSVGWIVVVTFSVFSYSAGCVFSPFAHVWPCIFPLFDGCCILWLFCAWRPQYWSVMCCHKKRYDSCRFQNNTALPFCSSIFGCRSSTFIESPEPRRLKSMRVTRCQLRIDIFARWDSLFSGNDIILLRLSRTHTTFSMDGLKEHLYTGNHDL
jgi:hypothetical protein